MSVDLGKNAPRPPQPPQQQDMPGHTEKMTPRPDHGEQSYRGSCRLEGRVAIITGADFGIGRAVAIAFAREGADVMIAYLNEHDDAEETARWVRKAGRKAVFVDGDIKDEQHCERSSGASDCVQGAPRGTLVMSPSWARCEGGSGA